MGRRPGSERPALERVAVLVGGWALVGAGIVLIPLPGPGWLVVGLGLLLLSRESRWARGALCRLERFMRRHGMRTSLRRLMIQRRRERARTPRPEHSA